MFALGVAAILLVGAAGIYILVCALRPEPGATMVLMGMPMILGAILVVGLFCVGMGALCGCPRRFNALAVTGLSVGLALFLGGILVEHVIR